MQFGGNLHIEKRNIDDIDIENSLYSKDSFSNIDNYMLEIPPSKITVQSN